MQPALGELVDPAHTVLVTQECQNGVIGEHAVFPALAETARAIIANLGRLASAARAAGVPVVHCLALRRPDGKGASDNARIFGAARKAAVTLAPGSDAAAVIPEVGLADTDIVLTRLHGVGPMWGTDLDPVLRSLGCSTIVGIGVSLNVGMTNFCMDAVNAGYRFVLPRDATAGVPASYADDVLEHTLSLLATIPTTDEVLAAWER